MDDNLLECPYCGEEQLTHEPEGNSMFLCRTKCECCGKYFVYAVTVARHYESFQDDEHNEMS